MGVRLQAQEVPGGGVAVERLLREGPVAETILRVAEELPGTLIVMGSHGKRGIENVLLGSVAESVLRRAACPVVTVRQPGR
jgi:universal stress protein A